MSLISRFSRLRIIEALLEQNIVQHDKNMAEAIANKGKLVSFSSGQSIIEQGHTDQDVYFLLAGEASLVVNGRTLPYTRKAGLTVGELSVLEPINPRTATIKAINEVVAIKQSYDDFYDLLESFPKAYKAIARDLARRLEERNSLVGQANERPNVFIISSAEGLEIARHINIGLDHENMDVSIWSDKEVFLPSTYPLEVLIDKVKSSDFAIAIARPDDIIQTRDKELPTVRDNVIFELGLFMSVLGRDRTFLVVPRNDNVVLPSDFKGLTPLEYKVRKDKSIDASALISKLAIMMKEKGVRSYVIK